MILSKNKYSDWKEIQDEYGGNMKRINDYIFVRSRSVRRGC